MDHTVQSKKHTYGLYCGGTCDTWKVLFSNKNLYEIEVFRKHGRITDAFFRKPTSKDYFDRTHVSNYRDAIKQIRIIENSKGII